MTLRLRLAVLFALGTAVLVGVGGWVYLRQQSGTLRDAYKIESELSGVVFASEDAKEGPKAFAEKREPRWQPLP